MRARHRHLNPKAAGAILALDSRYGFSVANGANISTWDDRSDTNDATDAGQTARQPTWQSGALNGQPAVRFDGGSVTPTNADELRVTLATAITANSLSCFSLSKKTLGGASSNFSRVFSLSNNDAADFNNTNSLVLDQTQGNTADPQVFRNSATVTKISADYDEWVLHSFTLDGTAVNARKAGGTAATGTTSATALNSNRINIGGVRAFATDSYFSGDMALITVVTSVVSAALRRRLEHAAAYSFKLVCA